MRHTAVMRDPAPASVSLAGMLENSVTHTQLGEWLQSPTRDIHARLVHFSSPSDGPEPHSYPSYSSSSPSHYPRSIRSSSSMAPACIHQSNTSTQAPSLYFHSEATPTETSISTGLASHFHGVPLLEEENGVLVRQQLNNPRPIFECAFWFLNCSYISEDEEEWTTHCLSHFRGEEPPKSIRCPLCDFQGTWDDGSTAWHARMEHIAVSHAMRGETLRTSRPDFHLFQHLWQKRLIDDQDLKELKGGNHNLTRTPSNFTTTNAPLRSNGPRQRDRTRGSQHVGHYSRSRH